MSEPRRKPTPEERIAFGPNVETLVKSLIGKGGDPPFFVPVEAPLEEIEAFLHSEAVFEATFDYVTDLIHIWHRQKRGKPLRPLVRGRKTEEANPLTAPDLSPEPRSPIDPKSEPMPEAIQDTESRTTQGETPAMPEVISESSPLPLEQTRADEPSMTPDPAPAPEPPELEQHPEPSADTTDITAETANPMVDSLDVPADEPKLQQPGDIPAIAVPPRRMPELRASFSLPNAKVGIEYAARIEARYADGRPPIIQDVKLPEGLGLHFDPESGELRGTPLTAGDHRLSLRWSPSQGISYSGECLLIVNPDPRSLWKVVEPPEDVPYQKSHTDSRLLQAEDTCLIAASRRGRSHEHVGSFRDDDYLIELDAENGWSLLIVADGAGSAQFSREGSRLAVTTAGAHLLSNLTGEQGARLSATLANWDAEPEASAKTLGTEFHYLFHEAATLAIQSIEQEAATQGAQPRDYATTFLAAVVKRQSNTTFIASFWMGDGAIAAYGPRGRVRLMGAPDGGEFAGQTRFLDRAALADQGFAKRIGIGRFPDLTAVLLMTDGVSDPRFETDNGLSDPNRWDALWDELAPILDAPDPEQALVDWLGFFSPGNHDDRTLALHWAKTKED